MPPAAHLSYPADGVALVTIDNPPKLRFNGSRRTHPGSRERRRRPRRGRGGAGVRCAGLLHRPLVAAVPNRGLQPAAGRPGSAAPDEPL
jgi:hypothetical protein